MWLLADWLPSADISSLLKILEDENFHRYGQGGALLKESFAR
jgi:hypothetical protein